MIKPNKHMHKRLSTYANYLSIGIGAAMVYVPEVVPAQYVPYVMMVCGVIVTVSQAVVKDANKN